jgi:hypothetical protein
MRSMSGSSLLPTIRMKFSRGLQRVLQRAEVDHRDQRPVDVVDLLLRRRRQLDQRRRVPDALRLPGLVVEVPAARAAAVACSRRPRRPSPSRRTPSGRQPPRRRSSPRPAPSRLLRPDDQRATVGERLVQQRALRDPLRVLADPVVVRRHPELPVVLAERLPREKPSGTRQCCSVQASIRSPSVGKSTVPTRHCASADLSRRGAEARAGAGSAARRHASPATSSTATASPSRPGRPSSCRSGRRSGAAAQQGGAGLGSSQRTDPYPHRDRRIRHDSDGIDQAHACGVRHACSHSSSSRAEAFGSGKSGTSPV